MRYFLNFFIGSSMAMCCFSVQAQNYPVFNSFYINPYLYNPAEAITDYTQVNAVYRQQWLNVEGSPKLSSLSFTTLLNETRTGIGAKFTTYSRGILNTSDFMVTYAHAVPMGKKNWLFFGLSGGAISHQIDLNAITNQSDLNDPAISRYLENNLQPASNAGFLWRSESGLNFGVALPQLFSPRFNSESSFSNTTVTPVDNIFATLYFRRKLESKMVTRRKGHLKKKVKTEESIAPLELYLNYKYSKFGNSQAEVLGKLNLSKSFWVGASYRLPYGFTGNLGIATNRLTLAYSYEPGSQPENGFSQGTHEIFLGLKLGEQKKFKRNAPVLRSTLNNTAERHTARFQETVLDPDKILKDEKADKKTFYVVIKAFTDFNQADTYKSKLRTEKFNAEVFYNKQDKKFYVHVLETEKSNEAHEEVRNLKTYTKLKEARVLTITGNK